MSIARDIMLSNHARKTVELVEDAEEQCSRVVHKHTESEYTFGDGSRLIVGDCFVYVLSAL